jgi:sulfoxide reductase catalytic subunit YedY
MLIRKPASWQAKPDEITPKSLFLNRRNIITGIGAMGVAGLVGCGASETNAATGTQAGRPSRGPLDFTPSSYSVSDPQTPYDAVTGYNNFYEFGTGKDDPARYAHAMTTDPWTVEVEGHASMTGSFSLADLIDYSKLEERIYRLRCVEAWSMVVPWVGVPLADVLQRLGPTEEARYVQFVSYANRDEMRGVRSRVLDWPYVEGLRMDEAMNELAFLAVGLYGETLPNQNGAPMRLVVPWKYGYKSAKSIVKIRFVSDEPETSWKQSAPREYGFYSNVNPNRAHPRWSQASERVIGGGVFARRQTEMFNGYSDQVAHLYEGMDLIENH